MQCLDLELVHMDAGVSGQQTRRRLQEVRRAYRRVFAWLWWFPFISRYIDGLRVRRTSLITTFGAQTPTGEF